MVQLEATDNPEAWHWYYEVVGNANCEVIDTWWQTETGSVLISPLPESLYKTGSATLPFFGVIPEIFDDQGSAKRGSCTWKLSDQTIMAKSNSKCFQ